MNWLDKLILRRQKRKYQKWLRTMHKKRVVLESPQEDKRAWSDAFMKAFRSSRR